MSIPAVGTNLKLGRGALLLAPFAGGEADDGYLKMGNIPSLELGWEIESVRKKSSTQSGSPILAEAVTSQELTLTAQCDEHTKDNMRMFFFGSVIAANQTASSTNQRAIDSVVTGRVYEIGHRNVIITSVMKGSTALVSGVDYRAYPVQGLIEFIDSAAVDDLDDLVVNYSRPIVSMEHIRIGQVTEQIARLRFTADDANQSGVSAKDQWFFPKVQVTPDGAYQLISEDFGPFSLRFLVIADVDNYPEAPLGRIERVAA